MSTPSSVFTNGIADLRWVLQESAKYRAGVPGTGWGSAIVRAQISGRRRDNWVSQVTSWPVTGSATTFSFATRPSFIHAGPKSVTNVPSTR